MNQTAECLFPFFDIPDVLSSLLRYPLPIRIGSYPGQMDPSGSNLQEEEDIVGAQEKRFHHKKVTRQQLLFVVLF